MASKMSPSPAGGDPGAVDGASDREATSSLANRSRNLPGSSVAARMAVARDDDVEGGDARCSRSMRLHMS